MAAIYFAMGDYLKAEPLYLKVLNIYAKALGKGHRDYAAAAGNLRLIYEKMGRYEEAEKYLLQVIEIYRSLFGEAHPVYVQSVEALTRLQKKISVRN